MHRLLKTNLIFNLLLAVKLSEKVSFLQCKTITMFDDYILINVAYMSTKKLHVYKTKITKKQDRKCKTRSGFLMIIYCFCMKK